MLEKIEGGSIEASFRACVKEGLLPKAVNPCEAAIGAMWLVSGLIANWVLDPKSFSLERHGGNLVNAYFRGLAAAAAAPATGTAASSPRSRRKAAA